MVIKKKAAQFINEGGQPSDLSKEEGHCRVTIRMPKKMLAGIDAARQSGLCATPRTTWILQAMDRVLQKDV